jgi:hypothetical protein
MSDDALSGAWQALGRTVPNYARHAAWEALASASAQQGKNFLDYLVMEMALDSSPSKHFPHPTRAHQYFITTKFSFQSLLLIHSYSPLQSLLLTTPPSFAASFSTLSTYTPMPTPSVLF